MNNGNGNYRQVLMAIRSVDSKCDKVLEILSAILGHEEDCLIESMRDAARNMYQHSLEERKRVGGTIRVLKHD